MKCNSIIPNISKRLKIARIANGHLTAKDFTDKYSIPASSYSQYENAKRTLSIEQIFYYSDLMKIDPVWLIFGKGEPCSDKEIEKKICNEQEKMYITGELEAESLPFISLEKQYSTVNIQLLKIILLILVPLLKDIPKNKIEEAVSFCFELYNKILTTNTDEKEKIKLIRICLDSFFTGLGIRITEEVIGKITIAV